MTLQKLVSSLIYAEHGWAVRDQFDATYEDAEAMDQQNPNALESVASIVKDLLRSELLAEGYELEELRTYYERLVDHLEQYS